MICEEDKKRIVEAKKCKDCLDWHHICHAECCKMIFIAVPPLELSMPGKYVILRMHCNKDDIWYYKLHGVLYHHGFLKFEKAKCRSYGQGIIYLQTCSMLQDMKCKGHYTKKPKLCSYLTEKTAKEQEGCKVTPNCLYRYKLMERNRDDKTKS